MGTTTADLIRDRIITVIGGLTPTFLSAAKFLPFTNKHSADFKHQCDQVPDGNFRRFQVRDLGEDQPPQVSNSDVEQRLIKLRIIVCYPQNYAANQAPQGKQALDRDRMMSTDQHQIEHAVGLEGKANFSSAVNSTYPDAFWRTGKTTRVVGRACDFLVIDQTMEFARSQGATVATTPMSTVTRDATSLIFCPANVTEWVTAMTVAANPTAIPVSLWLMAAASGNIPDAIGPAPLTANAGWSYQTAVANWSRKAMSVADGNGTATLDSGANFAGDIHMFSCMLYTVVALTGNPPAGTRCIGGMGGSTDARLAEVNTSGQYIATPNDGSATAIGAQNAGTVARPVVVLVDRTNQRWALFTDQEIIQPSPWTAPPNVQGRVWYGAILAATPAMSLLYAAMWQGPSAEMSNAQIRTLLQTLGWFPAW